MTRTSFRKKRKEKENAGIDWSAPCCLFSRKPIATTTPRQKRHKMPLWVCAKASSRLSLPSINPMRRECFVVQTFSFLSLPCRFVLVFLPWDYSLWFLAITSLVSNSQHFGLVLFGYYLSAWCYVVDDESINLLHGFLISKKKDSNLLSLCMA